MQRDFACPVCEAQQWHYEPPVEFSRNDEPRARSQSRRDYLRLRRQLLLDVWFDGADHAALVPQFCQHCGFMCYSPRPTAADLDAKYRYLAPRESTGAAIYDDERERRYDRERADRAWRLLTRRNARPASVLDVGGGDGRLLEPFVESGVECSIVDYNPAPRPGIRYLGTGFDDLPPGLRFETVICHHVLEHVVEPVAFLRQLFAHLEPGRGLAYIEVPLEIWRGIPIDIDPVTHVNYFTRASLCNAIVLAGGTVLRSRSIGGTYGRWRMPVAWALAAPGDGKLIPRVRSGASTQRLLDANWPARAWRRFVLGPQLSDGWQERRRRLQTRLQRLLRGSER